MPDVPTLADDLRLSIHRLTRRLRQQHPDAELTLTQLSALAIVWREGPMTAGELAAKEQVRPPPITRVLDGLVAVGMVSRTPSPVDGRQVLVGVTARGAEYCQENVRMRTAWLARQLEALEPQDQNVLREAVVLMDRLAAS